MSRRTEKDVTCPLCAHPFYRLTRLADVGQILTRFRFSRSVPVIMHYYPVATAKRCPLCYGKGWIKPELAVAYQIRFGEERESIEYGDIDHLRYQLTNSAIAYEITK